MKPDHSILPNTSLVGLALYFRSAKLLVLSDLQLGQESALIDHGVMVPKVNFRQIRKQLWHIFSQLKKQKCSVQTIVLNGDIKHAFHHASEQEWVESMDLIEHLKEQANEIVLVKGNHDTFLGPIAQWEQVRAVPEYYLPKEKILFIHGHKIIRTPQFAKAKTLVIGHEHPAVTLRDGAKVEKYKCFLKGKFEEKTIIVMPSFSALSEGTDVLQAGKLSPFLQHNLKNFEAWLVEDKGYYFGKLKGLG